MNCSVRDFSDGGIDRTMATTLCRACVVSASSPTYQHPCTSSNSVVCGSAPCLRTNLALVATEPHAGVVLSLCNRGRVSRSQKSRVRAEPQQIVVPNVDIQIEQDLYFREDMDDAELLSGIIVPNVDTQLAEDALSEVEDTFDDDVDEVDKYADREEVSLTKLGMSFPTIILNRCVNFNFPT